MITYHPVTLDVHNIEEQMDNLLKAISKFKAKYIFTYPNADYGHKVIIDKINEFKQNHNDAFVFHNLGQVKYLSLMKYVDVMIGNSSSGIIESPYFKLPVVNIGDRQKGRIRNKNIIDVGYNEIEIIKGIDKALYDKQFINSLNQLENVYGDGTTSEKVVKILKQIEINEKLLRKRLTY